MRVVLAGGGTAGHIEPALALADALRQADSGIQVTCLGTQRGLETRLVPMRGYELALIPAVPLPRSVSPRLLTVPGRLAGAVHTAGSVLERVHADVLVGFGGYVATPAYLAAKRHKVPIVVHEANPFPGIANRLGARLTTHVFTGHPDTKLRNAQYLGLPIRRQIAELDRFALGDKARAHFGLRTDLPVLLVFGGSQGAKSLNHALAGAIDAIRGAGVQVLHVTGPRNATEVQVPPGAVPYAAVPYVDRMDLAYAAADFALCRAAAASDMAATWSMLVSTGSSDPLIQSAVSSSSSTSRPPPRCTIGSALSRCSPFPMGSGTYAAGKPTAVSSAQVIAPARHRAKSAAA